MKRNETDTWTWIKVTESSSFKELVPFLSLYCGIWKHPLRFWSLSLGHPKKSRLHASSLLKASIPVQFSTVQFSSVTQSCPTLCDPMDCSTPGLAAHHQLPEFTQTHVHPVGDAIQPSHPLSSPSPPTFNLSQDQGLFKWVSSLHRVVKVLKFQLQYQSFQLIFRIDFL